MGTLIHGKSERGGRAERKPVVGVEEGSEKQEGNPWRAHLRRDVDETSVIGFKAVEMKRSVHGGRERGVRAANAVGDEW